MVEGKEQVVALNPGPLGLASHYLDQYRQIWEQRLDALRRSYDAPLDAVWRAWAEAERLRQWWGPDHVIIRECEVDLRVGGRLYIVMEAGEALGPYKGTRWPMDATFTVVEPKTKLAYAAHAWTEGREADTAIEQTTEITFSEAAGKTAVHVKAAIHKLGAGAAMAAEGMEYGFNQQFVKLERFLAANG